MTHDNRVFPPLFNGQPEPASPDLVDRILVAADDRHCYSLALQAHQTLAQLVAKSGVLGFLQRAVETADPATGTVGVAAILEQELGMLTAELAELEAALPIYRAREQERQAAVQSLLAKALDLESAKCREVQSLRQDINKATTRGRSQDDPEIVAWRKRIFALDDEIKALRAFQADVPLHRQEKLQGLALEPA